MMKKLIAFIVVTTLLFSGCSLFGHGDDSSSLSDKLAEVDREEGASRMKRSNPPLNQEAP